MSRYLSKCSYITIGIYLLLRIYFVKSTNQLQEENDIMFYRNVYVALNSFLSE